MTTPTEQPVRRSPTVRARVAAKRLLLRALRSLLHRYAAKRPSAEADPQGKVFILLVSAWGMGGTIRAAVNLAGYLADHHDVEILSAYRRRDQPFFAFGPGVTVTALDDERPGRTPWYLGPLRRLLRARSSALIHPADIRFRNFSLWTDLQLVRRLRGQSGFLIATRPGLNLLAANLELPGLVTVGVEQMHFASHAKTLRQQMVRRYGRLDGLAVLTEQDREEYRGRLKVATPLFRIPNTVRDVEAPLADMDAKVILAAGRLTPQKGYDHLIPAFAPVAERHPDWHLRICGNGQSRGRLQARIDALALQDRITLAGVSEDVPGEMARASVYALPSRFEGFPLVLIEAMSKGMACVAFDCPTGPADLIDDHRNGILVPARDVAAFTAGLMEMVEDEALRRRCGAAAVETARGYTMAAVGPRWDAMLRELLDARASAG